jgi:ferredoxin
MTEPRWTIVADVDLCQGHQMCVLEDPDVFGFDAREDKVEILRADLPDSAVPAARNAVKHCPAMALTLVESVKED